MIELICLKEMIENKPKSHAHVLLLNLLEVSFRFQLKVCNAFDDIMQKAVSFHNVAIVS